MKNLRSILVGISCLFCFSIWAGSAFAMGASIQGMGSWWDAGDAGSTYGLGIRGTIGEQLAVDLGYTYFGEGDDIHFRDLGNDDEIRFGGIDAQVLDLGLRYTLPSEVYFGGGFSYYEFGRADGDCDIDGDWGYYGLVGWSFGGAHLRGFIEGAYRSVEGTINYDNEITTSNDANFDYDGFNVNVGAMFRF